MIVQPDFPEHWKTRLLVEITKDESSPLAVIRLWAHCQHSRRSEFPEMTKEQLASVCRWNDRKPPCNVALVKAGFVEKLRPKGFAAHQWSEHNAQLLQKWAAGQKGGRPPTAEKANETGLSEKPTDNRPLTGTKPDESRLDERREDKSEYRIEPPRHKNAAPVQDSLGKLLKSTAQNQPRQDWHGMNLRQKLLFILGAKEATDPRWERRGTNAPEELVEILDKMNADIREGNVIRNRGAYAEELWKISRRLT